MHNIDVLFKYKCKYKNKISDDLFNITGYIVDFEFIENRKENDTEPQLSSSPLKAISLKTENSYLLKVGTKYIYIIISIDPSNKNIYDLIDFQIMINDKESSEYPKFCLPQNEYFYGKVENDREHSNYKLNLSSKNDNFLKIEIIKNTNDENFKWEIFSSDGNFEKNKFIDNYIIKSNTTKNGKTSIILEICKMKPNEISMKLYKINDYFPSEYILRYFSYEYEYNFTYYNYNISDII